MDIFPTHAFKRLSCSADKEQNPNIVVKKTVAYIFACYNERGTNMKKQIIAGMLCLLLMLPTLFSLSGCGTSVQAADLMAGVKANTISTDVDLTGENAAAVAAFAVKLFQNSAAEENTLISPLSVLCALAMTANGVGTRRLRRWRMCSASPCRSLITIFTLSDRPPLGR